MNKKTSKLWNIPVISVYLYAVTILTQYGFHSYFNIPSSFIESSIKENIIYFFQLFQLASGVVGLMKWWMWIVAILAILIITFFYNFSNYKKIIALCGTLLLGLLLYGSYGFGTLIAKSTTEFYVPAEQCASLDVNNSYIIPSFYGGRVVLIPIDKTRKMSGDILVKDISELGCTIEKKYIGTITK